MLDVIAAFVIPTGLTVFSFNALLVINFAAAFLSVVCGVGGGTLLVASMAVWLPVSVVIPVHAAIQLSSNIARVGISFRSIDWPLAISLSTGTLIGIGIGMLILPKIPAGVVQIILGAFVLYTLWGVMPKPRHAPAWLSGFVGVFTGGLSMLVGATGPLLAAYVRTVPIGRFSTIGVLALTLTLQNALKVMAFITLGFAFAHYLPFIGLMILIGLLGTWAGRLAVGRMDEAFFHQLLRVALTLLSLRLGYTGIRSLLAS